MAAQRKAHVDEEATAGSLSICWKQQVKSVLSPALRRIEKERERQRQKLIRTRHCWSLKAENLQRRRYLDKAVRNYSEYFRSRNGRTRLEY